MKIKRVAAREIYNSEGWPTVQCELFLENGMSVNASVPSGTSVGIHEAVEFRDGGMRLNGKGVLKAVENIELKIAPLILGQSPKALEMDLRMIELDGTPDKSKLGANAILAVSMALYRAEALCEGVELYELFAELLDMDSVTMPFPFLNLINGGVHANNGLRIQEFMVVPTGGQSFRASFERGVEVFHALGELLRKEGKSTAVGIEGGYVGGFANEKEALDLLFAAVKEVNAKQEFECALALDIAASSFYSAETGLYQWGDDQYTSDQMIAYYEGLISQYPICSLEDGLSQDDWEGWKKLTQALGDTVQIVGDDLCVTDVYRIVKAADEQAATSVIIKPNQVGTITEVLQAISFSKHKGLQAIVSHRSLETEDSFIADLAIGTNAGQIKAGSSCRSEHLAKYNRILAIEDELTFALLNDYKEGD